MKEEFKSAGDLLSEKVSVYKYKTEKYGSTYRKYGDLCKVLFPDGLEIKTESDFNRWGVFSMILHKILRISNSLFGEDNADSIKDIQIYGAILEELVLFPEGEKYESSK